MFRTTDMIDLTSNNNGLFHYNDSTVYIFRFFCSFPLIFTVLLCHVIMSLSVCCWQSRQMRQSIGTGYRCVIRGSTRRVRSGFQPGPVRSTCWCLPPENGSTWERRKTQAWQSKGALQWQISFWGLSHLHCSASKVDRSHRCIKSYNTTYSV